MTAKEFIRLMRRHWLLLVLIPVTTAASIYFFSRFQDKKYLSDTVIYTGIASGYKIDGGNNNNGGGWNATATAFDNLLSLITSRETKEEVGLRLLAWRLTTDALNPTSYTGTQAQSANVLGSLQQRLAGTAPTDHTLPLPDSLRVRLTGPTVEATLERVVRYYKSGNHNLVFKLINSKAPFYSEDALSNVVASRVKDSDLVKIEYTAKDPLMCRQTLEIMTEVFIRKHKELFTGQNESVIGYFSASAQKAYDRLQKAEQQLLDFHQRHNIVDYDKQILASTDEKQAAIDKYNSLEMQYAGAFSTLKSVENTLSKRGVSNLKSQEIIRLRNRLSDLSSRATELEIMQKAQPSASAAAHLASLKQEADQVSEKIGETVNSYYADSHSVQGVAVKDLLSDYTKNTLLVEDLRSQLNQMRRQKQASAGQYNQLVPLGAEIRKIRREVEVAEKEYLSQVEGLKQSKLSQQNSVLASQLRVVDPPYLPLDPNGSKLVLLLVGGFLGSFLLTGAGVVTTSMLNTSLQHPAQASKVTSFPVVGVVPKPMGTPENQQQAAKRAEDHLARQLLLKFQRKLNPARPYVIGVLSTQLGEGKTDVCCHLAASLNDMRIKTLSMFPSDHTLQLIPNRDTSFYSPLQGLRPGVTVADLAGRTVFNDTVIIVEFPALLEAAYPASLLQELDLILLTVKADRAWSAADRAVMSSIKAVSQAPIELVLNGVLPDYVAEFIGTQARGAHPYASSSLPSHPEQALLQ